MPLEAMSHPWAVASFFPPPLPTKHEVNSTMSSLLSSPSLLTPKQWSHDGGTETLEAVNPVKLFLSYAVGICYFVTVTDHY